MDDIEQCAHFIVISDVSTACYYCFHGLNVLSFSINRYLAVNTFLHKLFTMASDPVWSILAKMSLCSSCRKYRPSSLSTNALSSTLIYACPLFRIRTADL